jgi:hypothetical protein
MVKTADKQLAKIQTSEYRDQGYEAIDQDKYKIILNSDLSARSAIKGNDGLIYKDLTAFDIYTRPMRINFGSDDYDPYFLIIPESWVTLYIDDSGIYLNYIPISDY